MNHKSTVSNNRATKFQSQDRNDEWLVIIARTGLFNIEQQTSQCNHLHYLITKRSMGWKWTEMLAIILQEVTIHWSDSKDVLEITGLESFHFIARWSDGITIGKSNAQLEIFGP